MPDPHSFRRQQNYSCNGQIVCQIAWLRTFATKKVCFSRLNTSFIFYIHTSKRHPDRHYSKKYIPQVIINKESKKKKAILAYHRFHRLLIKPAGIQCQLCLHIVGTFTPSVHFIRPLVHRFGLYHVSTGHSPSCLSNILLLISCPSPRNVFGEKKIWPEVVKN